MRLSIPHFSRSPSRLHLPANAAPSDTHTAHTETQRHRHRHTQSTRRRHPKHPQHPQQAALHGTQRTRRASEERVLSVWIVVAWPRCLHRLHLVFHEGPSVVRHAERGDRVRALGALDLQAEAGVRVAGRGQRSWAEGRRDRRLRLEDPVSGLALRDGGGEEVALRRGAHGVELRSEHGGHHHCEAAREVTARVKKLRYMYVRGSRV